MEVSQKNLVTQFDTELLTELVIKRKVLTTEEFAFYCYMKGFAFYQSKRGMKKNPFKKKLETAAQEWEIHIRTVHRYVNKLKKVGLVQQRYRLRKNESVIEVSSQEQAYQMAKTGKGKLVSSWFNVLDYREIKRKLNSNGVFKVALRGSKNTVSKHRLTSDKTPQKHVH